MSNKYYIFLDDMRQPRDVVWERLPNHPWTIVRNYKEFRDTIWNQGIPEFVCYDHDLADSHYNVYHGIDDQGHLEIDYSKFKEKTGLDCAKFLCNECNKLGVKHPQFLVHSMNPVGKQNIISIINSYNKTI